jgi:hypothetical protein
MVVTEAWLGFVSDEDKGLDARRMKRAVAFLGFSRRHEGTGL